MLLRALFCLAAASTPSVLAAFGFRESGGNYVVDAGSVPTLAFSVSRSTCDILSILFAGVELQSPVKGSHISSGLGGGTQVTVEPVGAKYIKVTCTTATLIHYMVVVRGESRIYMATYISQQPAIGELRFIARLRPEVLPNEYPNGVVSRTAGASKAIEGSDVFLVGDSTRSKFYSSLAAHELTPPCVYGNGGRPINVCMLAPVPETSSGGPFHRDIRSNYAGDSNNLYLYMNSAHSYTGLRRLGLYGPYALQFSQTMMPRTRMIDTSFFSELAIKGYVPASGRGFLKGVASGVPNSFPLVVHMFNQDAQYWTKPPGNQYVSPPMKPGNYTMELYRYALKVAEVASVQVVAGRTTRQNIASTWVEPRTLIFPSIGQCDGRPFEFRNGAKFLRMHPSDSRMDSWLDKPVFVAGSDVVSDFPMALFKSVNNNVTIHHELKSDPGAATLRISTTSSFLDGRPRVRINNFALPVPAAPPRVNSRIVTRGAYYANAMVYTFNAPAGTLRPGQNTITIAVESGSEGLGFLSSNFIFDCIEFWAAM